MIKKLIIMFIAGNLFLYVAGSVMAEATTRGCKGWQCEEVFCPDKYAVRLPDGSYLPCEHFDKYIDGDESVVIKNKPNYPELLDKMIADGDIK